jgi:hypothetical protein
LKRQVQDAEALGAIVINRRQAIGTGLAVSALTAAGIELLRPVQAVRSGTPLKKFVVDVRFAEAIAIAGHAAQRGTQVLELQREVMELWHDHLAPGNQADAFGGCTTTIGLFLIETLAADRRMRVVYRAEHSPHVDGRITHSIKGAAATLTQIADSGEAMEWTRRMARAFDYYQAGAEAVGETTLSTSAQATLRDEALVTWIIAPLRSSAPAA